MRQNVLFILAQVFPWSNQRLPVNADSDPIVIEALYCGMGYQVFAMLQGTHSSPALTHIASARHPGLTLGLQEQVWINPTSLTCLKDLLTFRLSGSTSTCRGRSTWAASPINGALCDWLLVFTYQHTWLLWRETYSNARSRDCPVSSGKGLPALYPSFSVLIALSQSPSTAHSSMRPVSRISQKLLVCCKEPFFSPCGPPQMNACGNAKSCSSKLQPGWKCPYYSKK